MTQPGWRPGETMAEYLADPAIGSSLLRALNERDKTPAHVRWDLDHPKPASDAQRLGEAADCAILEPDEFKARYVTSEQCTAKLESGKRKGKQCLNPGTRLHGEHGWRCGTHSKHLETFDDTKTVLTFDDYTQVIAMQNAVWAHPRAGKIMAAGGEVQQSGYWTDPVTGLLLKIRPDLLIADHGLEISLKTTKNASEDGWQFEMERYNYHMAAAFYRDGLIALDWPWNRQLQLLVENYPPHLVAVREVSQPAVDEGARLNRKWLDVWAECLETGEFPGYDERIKETTLPERYWRRLEYEEISA